MKKVVMFILIIILAVVAYFMIFDNAFPIKNKEEIVALNVELEDKISQVNRKITQEYASGLQGLKDSIKRLETAKGKYEQYNVGEELTTTVTTTYKIEYLWATIGQYAKKRNTQLTLDLVENSDKISYDMKFTLIGDYTDIIYCISDIEEDDTFEFKISNFKIEPYTKILTTTDVEYEEIDVPSNTSNSSVGVQTTQTTTQDVPYTGLQQRKEEDDTTVASIYNPKQLIATFDIESVGIEF